VVMVRSILADIRSYPERVLHTYSRTSNIIWRAPLVVMDRGREPILTSENSRLCTILDIDFPEHQPSRSLVK
jgi:hypothetical protein